MARPLRRRLGAALAALLLRSLCAAASAPSAPAAPLRGGGGGDAISLLQRQEHEVAPAPAHQHEASAFAAVGARARRRAWTDVRGPRRMSDDEVWAAMRHLYPGAPLERPRNRSALLGAAAEASGASSEALRLGKVEVPPLAGAKAAAIADVACEYYFSNQRSIKLWKDDLWKKWPELDEFYTFLNIGLRPEVTFDEMRRTVTVRNNQMFSTFKYNGPHFGCVQIKQWSAEDGHIPSPWEAAMAGHLGAPEEAKSFLASAPVNGSRLAGGEKGGDEFGGMNDGRTAPPAANHVLNTFADKVMGCCGTSAVAVWYKGLLIERYEEAYGVSQSSRLQGWSMSKSLLSLLFGARHAQIPNEFNEDTFAKVPELTWDDIIERGMTMKNFLNMRVGKAIKEGDTKTVEMLFGAPDAAKYAATEDSGNFWPSATFTYSSAVAVLLSRELRYTFPEGDAGAAEYAEYPWTALFNKLNATFACETDAAGTLLMSTLCHGTLRDWLKIGLLVLNKGKWNEEQVIPAEWIDKSTKLLDLEKELYASHTQGNFYSHLWYRVDVPLGLRTPVIAARGVLGQELLIVPELEMVVVRTGATYSNILQDWDIDGSELVPLLNELVKLERDMQQRRLAPPFHDLA